MRILSSTEESIGLVRALYLAGAEDVVDIETPYPLPPGEALTD